MEAGEKAGFSGDASRAHVDEIVDFEMAESIVSGTKRKKPDDAVKNNNDPEAEVEPEAEVDQDQDDEDLDDEDFFLLEENLGYKVKKKFKRVRRIDSSDEEEEGQDKERDDIANELFDFDISDDEGGARKKKTHDDKNKSQSSLTIRNSEEESESEDDFIVDEFPGASRRRGHGGSKQYDPCLIRAREIFGNEFDYDDLQEVEDVESEDEYDEEDRRSVRPRTKKTPILKFYEPIEIQNKFLDPESIEICKRDVPERFQRRVVPVTSIEDEVLLHEEASWILTSMHGEGSELVKKVVVAPPVVVEEENWDDISTRPSYQDAAADEEEEKAPEPEIEYELRVNPKLEKIKVALDLIRNRNFDIANILTYHREKIEPELGVDDLWRILELDGKFCHLKERKDNLLLLVDQMLDFIAFPKALEEKMGIKNLEYIRQLTSIDLEDVKTITSHEELNDTQKYFMFHYGFLVQDMKIENSGEEEGKKIYKAPTRMSTYESAIRSHAIHFLQFIGLDFMDIRKHLIEETSAANTIKNTIHTPEDIVDAIIEQNGLTTSPEVLLKECTQLVAESIALDPKIRKGVRYIFSKRATINVRPTELGEKLIDECHPLFRLKYLSMKPVSEVTAEQTLLFLDGEKEKLITLEIAQNVVGEEGGEYCRDLQNVLQDGKNQSYINQSWNEFRAKVVEIAMNEYIFPEMRKRMRDQMITDAHEEVIRECQKSLRAMISVGPYKVSEYSFRDKMEWPNHNDGLRVLSLVFTDEVKDPVHAIFTDSRGEYLKHYSFDCFLKRNSKSFSMSDAFIKEKDLLLKKIIKYTPHVIVIGGYYLDALSVRKQLLDLVGSEIWGEKKLPILEVEILDVDLAQVIGRTTKTDNLPDYICEGVSLARRMRDPLLEFSQVCNKDNDILCLKLNKFQGQVNQEELSKALYNEMSNKINELGVDFSQCLTDPYYANILQFVSGLGPCKAFHLLGTFRRKPCKLENRTQLVTVGNLGPSVFKNCCGFIKINTAEYALDSEHYIEHLDCTRIHPENYEEARMVASSALDMEQTEDIINPAVIEDVFKDTSVLDDLDYQKYVTESKKRGANVTLEFLHFIRDELKNPFEDKRHPFLSPNISEIVKILTRGFNLCEGKLYTGKVLSVYYAWRGSPAAIKELRENVDSAKRDPDDEHYVCPNCGIKFIESTPMATHQLEECKGPVSGVFVELERGITGFIPICNLSDQHTFVKPLPTYDIERRIYPGKVIYIRISQFEILEDRVRISLTSRTSDLQARDYFKYSKENARIDEADPYYDDFAEMRAKERRQRLRMEAGEKAKRQQALLAMKSRKCVHPDFKNYNHEQALNYLKDKPHGSIIIRPSSKGPEFLALVLKITNDIFQYILIREEERNDANSKSGMVYRYFIGDEEFEDLNEITDNNIIPINQFHEEIMHHKSYSAEVQGDHMKAERVLRAKSENNPKFSQYILSASKKFPGMFLLSYAINERCGHEAITVTRVGFHYRSRTFTAINSLLAYFKLHYTEPPPGYYPPPYVIPNAPSAVYNANTPGCSITPGMIDDNTYTMLKEILPQ